MRPLKFTTLSPKTANVTEFNAGTFNSTGAATAPTTTVTSDGLAHTVTLVAPAQATLAGVTFTIVGTDADGRAQTETGLVGPASGATVTSSKYFKAISTIQPSATMGALVVSVGMSAVSISPCVRLDYHSISPAALTVQVTGTVNYTVKDTIGDTHNYQIDEVVWTAITALTTKAVDTDGAARTAANAVQVVTNSVTNGATLVLWVSQASQAMA